MLELPNASLQQRAGEQSGRSPGQSTLTRSYFRLRAAPLLVIATLLGLALFNVTPSFADSASATVNSPDGLNLRAGPGTMFDVITVLPSGATVSVVGATGSGDWLEVRYNTLSGWALATYLTVTRAATPPAAALTVLPPDGLNLRGGPGTTYNPVAVIPGGASVTVTGSASDSWLPVSYGSQTGWANAAFLSQDGLTPLLTSSATSSSSGASVSPAAAPANGAAPSATAAPNPAPVPAPQPAASNGASPQAAHLIWPVNSRRISTVFSPSHPGVDIDEFDEVGGPVVASAGGTVTFSGGDPCCSYGLYVIIDHGNGLSTLYAHFSHIDVAKGQVVTQGQRLGASGCTGLCTGPHVHYEVRVNNHSVDPLTFLPPPWRIE
jgi:murein DD-endopeptidase MepM/ murein hydrolase activator NlpD